MDFVYQLLKVERRGNEDMENRLAKSFPLAVFMLPLKFAVAALPYKIMILKWPAWHDHKSVALGVGTGVGVLCAQLIPPRQPFRWIILTVVIFSAFAAILPALSWLR